MSQIDTSNPFQSFILSPQEEEMALAVTPYTLMYLQNKLAAYAANALFEGENDEVSIDPKTQAEMAAKTIKSRAQIAMLREIINEFTEGANLAIQKQQMQSNQSSEN